MNIYNFGDENEIYLTREEFNALEDFHPNSKVPNNEGSFKLFTLNGKRKLIKGFYFTNKYDAIKTNLNILITYKQILNESIPSLVLPEDYVYLYSDYKFPLCCTLEMIEGTNLYDILHDESYSPRKKINLLSKLGQIVDTFGTVPNFPYPIYIGDLHEGNIMITKDGEIKIIDTLSCYIETKSSEPQCSKYLIHNNQIQSPKFENKYKQSDGIIIPNRNTDIFCYSFIVLNALTNTEMIEISLSGLYNYLDYLEHLKFNREFLESVTRLFTTQDNINPHEFVSTITSKQFRDAHHLTYKRKTGIDLSKL